MQLNCKKHISLTWDAKSTLLRREISVYKWSNIVSDGNVETVRMPECQFGGDPRNTEDQFSKAEFNLRSYHGGYPNPALTSSWETCTHFIP